jgi:hypothetical protein
MHVKRLGLLSKIVRGIVKHPVLDLNGWSAATKKTGFGIRRLFYFRNNLPTFCPLRHR